MVNSPAEYSPKENSSAENSPVSFPQIVFVEKMFLVLKIWFVIYEGDQQNIYNRLYLFIRKVDYLSETFNIDKMHSNRDLDLI